MKKRVFAAAGVALVAAAATIVHANAAATSAGESTAIVGEASADWTVNSTDGAVSFLDDSTAPLGSGALQLTTEQTIRARAELTTQRHAGLKLSDVEKLAYSAKQIHASGVEGDAALELGIDLDGNLSTTADRTTLVYEPYFNNGGRPPAKGVWQDWNVAAGKMWSTRTVNGFAAGAGGPPFYTLADAIAMEPSAVVTSVTVGIGSNNPGYVVEADKVVVNDTTYDFEHRAKDA